VHPFEYADIFAKVSGYLKTQSVDIGDHVKAGQTLAEIDMPELVKEVERDVATVAQARAQVAQMKAKVSTSIADHVAALAVVQQSEADLAKFEANLSFREKQYNRIKALFDLDSVDKKLVDERQDERDAARSALRSAEAAVSTAEAQTASAAAKIEQAKADLAEAESKVQVEQAVLEKTQVLLNYTKIISPYNGVVTARNSHPGDFIRAADQGAEHPLLSVAKTDVMRVVVQVPDQDVPFTNRGDEATVEIDALRGTKFNGKVSRMATVEDPHTRTMRTEIDLPNPNGVLRGGMYGRVTIVLEKPSDAMRIPASCLVGQSDEGTASVYVVRDGRAHRTQVKLGADNGLQLEVLSGLNPNDQVVTRYNGAIGDNVAVEVLRP
jgi:RND family efflux transporter MFP subunit